jgi:hypothetical protein
LDTFGKPALLTFPVLQVWVFSVIFSETNHMKLFATALCFLTMTIAASSQTTAEDSVKIAIGRFFTAIRNSDGMAYKQAFTDSAAYQHINWDKSGEPVIKASYLMQMALLISSVPRGAADPRISFDMVKVNGFFASAWVPFKFYLNGQQLYCSVASFQMLRVQGVWKIQYYIDRQVACQ